MATTPPRTIFTHQDLRDAVRDGAVSEAAADAFRAYLESRSQRPDEEEFHLFRGFNDVFVALASLLLFSGIAWFNSDWGMLPVCLLIIVVAVALSEYFTLRKRLALASILYALAFSIAAAAGMYWAPWSDLQNAAGGGAVSSSFAQIPVFDTLAALICGAVAAGLFWWRYRVPIAVAVGVFFVGAALYGAWLLFAPFDNPMEGANVVLFVLGIATFAFAMYWDVRDLDRTSRTSDVAFWLHLVAAPAIAHPVFSWVQSSGLPADWLEATSVVVCYLCLACVALLVNRRAIMVAATVYLIGAVAWYFEELSGSYNIAIAMMLIGCLFLAMAAWWSTVRAAIIGRLPNAVRHCVAPA